VDSRAIAAAVGDEMQRLRNAGNESPTKILLEIIVAAIIIYVMQRVPTEFQ